MEEEKKLTIAEYINKYNSKSRNPKYAKKYSTILASFIGLAEIVLLYFLVSKIYSTSKIGGYIAIGVAVIFFIFSFIVPICKFTKTKSFDTNLRYGNQAQIKRYNKALRKEISEKMIDMYRNADVRDWYSFDKVNALAVALKSKNDNELKIALSDILVTDVKKASNKMIVKHAVLAFGATAISQSDKLDSLFIITSEIDLIKRLVTLYGYRPNDEHLLKIYKSVLVSALLSYGASALSTNLVNGIGQKIIESTSSVSIFGPAIETVLGSTIDGLANLTFTVKVGIETKKYLKREYHLQDLLDEMEIEENVVEEEAELLKEARVESSKLKKKVRKKTVK